ncbi:glycoside/pentoside/hexuronide:cation symporter, GPH family [Halpernia humi]|uniref:Endo-1,3-beta-glucanase btgC n=1 Tax=Halpernia humi TaxID=493375 RepID=A0A1H5UAK0_9FLAO|nr:MFS transporter [Halpernia humi]SEF71448.1 glycoside/pentoside/hexuronide:cation symporter, GPH family [Halpernia humi]
MDQTVTKSTGKVPFGQKVAFGLGMLANQMFPAALGIFMVVLIENLKIPTLMYGLLFFLPRILDAFIDPIMGFISDNTRSKWGRRRQYVFIGSIIMGISFVIMWQLHREDSVNFIFYYFLFWSTVFYLGLSIFSVPFVAMGYEMSDDFHERTSIMAISQFIGQWAWIIAPWFWVIMYDPSWFPNADTATRTLAVIVGLSCMVLAMIPAVFIKSKSTIDEESFSPLNVKTIGSSLTEIFESFKEAFKNKPFTKLCISTFLIFNAFNTVAGFTFFIVVYYLFKGDAAAAGIWPTLFGCLGAVATTFVVIPIVSWMSKKMEKKRAFLVCQGISIFGYILLWFLFVPGKPYMFIFALPFFSFGIGSLFTLMMSMTADVCDLDELTSGKRREGIFGAIYWWMVKFGFAIAGLLTGVIMSLVGFDPSLPVQTEDAVTGLRLFFSGVPIAGTLIAMVVMWNYNLTEAKAREIQKELAARKAPVKKQSYSALSGKLLSLTKNATLINSKFGLDLSSVQENVIQNKYSEILEKGLHGLCFSPYLKGQQIGDTLSQNQIRRRLDIIAPHTKWVRSFSCTEGNELIPEIANKKGLKTLVGAWISEDKVKNEQEIQSLINLAKAGLVDIAAVGNEVLHREELSEQELIGYIKRVREALPDSIPVGYVDAYYQFLDKPNLVEACDLILANCYPFWEGAENENALAYLDGMVNLTREVAKGKKIIITETGWPSKGENVGNAKPSEFNAMKYFISAQEYSKNQDLDLFYFSSFDESWKEKQEGEVGAKWGIWDESETLKFGKK